MDWPGEVTEQLEWHWTNQLRPRLEGLADEEYLWEPGPGAWSVRPRRPGGTSTIGSGELVIDFAYPAPIPTPVTTIAWRLAHVVVGCFGARSASHFGGPPVSYEDFPYAATAAEALDQLDAAYATWRDGVRALGEEGMARPCGPAEGPYADRSMATLVLHINREVIHHGAEIALLRDLWAHR